jgi:hypothetical protein
MYRFLFLASVGLILMPHMVVAGELVRKGPTDGQGAVVEGCINIADKARNRFYSTQSYQTTRASAWAEGAAAGLQEGLSNQGAAFEAARKALANPLPESGDPVFRDGILSVKPFCRVYQANRREVAKIVAAVLLSMDNPVIASDIEKGIFQTGLIKRELWNTKWQDSYVITVTEERSNRVIVRILRDVYISRQGSAYHQAKSNGKNEVWIFTQILNEFNPSYD